MMKAFIAQEAGIIGAMIQYCSMMPHCHSSFLVNEISSDLLQPKNQFVALPYTAMGENWTLHHSGVGKVLEHDVCSGGKRVEWTRI